MNVPASRLSFKINNFQVIFESDLPEAILAILENISPEWLSSNFDFASGPSLNIQLITGSADPRDEGEAHKCRYLEKNYGMVWRVFLTENKIQVITHRNSMPHTVLFHIGFLQPLSYLLNHQRSTLIHSALVSGAGGGALIVGKSGSGKSSFSLALLRNGFFYYSDEAPIISLKKGAVKGYALPTKIGLKSPALKLFSEKAEQWNWEPAREKFCLNPVVSFPSQIGTDCEIKCIIFSVLFTGRAPSRQINHGARNISKANPRRFFSFRLNYFRDSSGLDGSLEVLGELARVSPAYEITYGPNHVSALGALVTDTIQ